MSRALVVGINEYRANPLYGCVNDAESMEKMLRLHGDGSFNMQIKKQLNVKTQAELMGHIKEVFSGKTDIALFYYSGHGYVNHLGGYLVTPDATGHNEGVRMNDIIQVANESKSLNRVIILDCCHAGAIADNNPDGGMNINIMEGVTVLTASRTDQVAMEANRHGIFTNLLLLALEGGAADIRGMITPGSIYAYIDQALGEFGQRPVFKTNITKFAALRKVVPQLPLETLVKITTYFPEKYADRPLDPSYEETNIKDGIHRFLEPYAVAEKVAILKGLQQMVSVGLVVPVGVKHMYDAAMESKSCRLTPLGQHYWTLIKEDKIN